MLSADESAAVEAWIAETRAAPDRWIITAGAVVQGLHFTAAEVEWEARFGVSGAARIAQRCVEAMREDWRKHE